MATAEPTSEPMPTLPVPRAGESDHYSGRRFLQSAILFAIVVLTIRAVALEPFGVPTGSMAPAMFGNHKRCTCPRCGWDIVGGAPGPNRADVPRKSYAGVWCTNCGQGDLGLESMRETVGDRLMVDKNVYEWRRPRRWEIAVFHNPSDLTKPYVKRIVGLPGETVQIVDGDVHVNERISRKSLPECRAVQVPVFDIDYQPPGGWGQRFRRTASESLPPALATDKSLPEAGEHLNGAELRWTGREVGDEWIVYRHWLLDEGREEPIHDWFAYNGGVLRHELNLVHDFIVTCEVEAGEGEGTLSLRLHDGQTSVVADIPITARSAPGRGIVLHGTPEGAASAPWAVLTPGRTHRLEFAFVDRRVMLSLDGREAFTPVDLPAVRNRSGVSRPLSLKATGTAVTVRHLRLYRDVHYTSGGRNAIYDAWPLKDDEYFMLGDNSPNSEDSRYWTRPGIPAANFLGRPLVAHQPSRWTKIGKWDVQSVDWPRVRWIR